MRALKKDKADGKPNGGQVRRVGGPDQPCHPMGRAACPDICCLLVGKANGQRYEEQKEIRYPYLPVGGRTCQQYLRGTTAKRASSRSALAASFSLPT